MKHAALEVQIAALFYLLARRPMEAPSQAAALITIARCIDQEERRDDQATR